MSTNIVEQIIDKFNELTDKEKLIAQLYYVERLSVDKIGYILDIDSERVNKYLDNIIEKINIHK